MYLPGLGPREAGTMPDSSFAGVQACAVLDMNHPCVVSAAAAVTHVCVQSVRTNFAEEVASFA